MRRDCPSRLYKYLAPERWSFIADLRVRYSQLGAFNDPFEGRPEITSISTREDMLATAKSILPDEMNRTYESLPPNVRAMISYKQVLVLAEHLALAKQDEMLGTLESITHIAASFITGKIDQVLGAFCLSEVPDSLLMWAHYSSSHTGLVVEFDAWHSVFHEQKSEEDDLRHVRRVNYRETRPSAPLSDISAIELFLVKSGHWGYEREWRIVRPLADAVSTIPAQPYPVALFEIPPDAVTGVILGARINSEVEENIRLAIAANDKLHSIRIRRAVPDSTHFHLRLTEDS